MDNQTPNPEEVFKAMIMFILALEAEAQAFQDIATDNMRVRVCLN